MVKTRGSSDWDSGDKSFVHSMHKFVHSNVDVFPMYFISNNKQMQNIWYRVKQVPRVCACVQELVAMDVFEAVTNSMAGEYVSTPVVINEFNNLKVKVSMLQSFNDEHVKSNILFKQRVDNQQSQIDNLFTIYQFLQPQPPPTEPDILAVSPLPVLEPVTESLGPSEGTHNPCNIGLIETPVQPAHDVVSNVEPVEPPALPAPAMATTPPSTHAPAMTLTYPASFMSLIQNGSAIFAANKPYTKQEDNIIIEFAKKNVNRGGKILWKNLEASGLLPGRTHQSLRNRYLLHIWPKLRIN